ncbi:MAG: ATP-binding protein [Lachnospiraceae bacterium]|nr:ATP-binding protein [Lachnospiraceae bacterium]
MEFQRDYYIKKLIDRKNNGFIKVITGIRRCGKSYLLFNLFKKHLIKNGVKSKQIIELSLDDDQNEELLDRKKLGEYVRNKIIDDRMYYLLIDEIQFVEGFEKVLNGLIKIENLDVYVTGSNSKFLSTDILTEFRGRGDEVRVYPLSFKEIKNGFQKLSNSEIWKEISTFGSLPQILNQPTDDQKKILLNTTLKKVYMDDIINRNNINKTEYFEKTLNILASTIGSLTNPRKIADTFVSEKYGDISHKTVADYIEYSINAFLIEKAERYDVKGRKYISSPYKYYFTDIGIRNAKLNFRQYEPTHIMENIIYNELLKMGYSVDVGVVIIDEKAKKGIERKRTEVDFVINDNEERYYIQVAYSLSEQSKMDQELKSLRHIKDNFKKVVITFDDIKPYTTDDGIRVVNIYDFLLIDSIKKI